MALTTDTWGDVLHAGRGLSYADGRGAEEGRPDRGDPPADLRSRRRVPRHSPAKRRDEIDRVEHGARLKDWAAERRLALNLTQEEVAERMSAARPDLEPVPGNYIVRLEGGYLKTVPLQPKLGQLAAALETSEVAILRAAGLITEPPERGAAPPADPLLARVVEEWACLRPATRQMIETALRMNREVVQGRPPDPGANANRPRDAAPT